MYYILGVWVQRRSSNTIDFFSVLGCLKTEDLGLKHTEHIIS
jgi:hypothetical protein